MIESRCLRKQTGSSWQRDVVARLEQRGHDRSEALAAMLHRYVELTDSGEPVHAWPLE